MSTKKQHSALQTYGIMVGISIFGGIIASNYLGFTQNLFNVNEKVYANAYVEDDITIIRTDEKQDTTVDYLALNDFEDVTLINSEVIAEDISSTINAKVDGGLEDTIIEIASTEEKALAFEEATVRNEANNVPNINEGCKSWNITYMPYTAVTSVSSAQYKLLYSDECYTDPVTGIRMVDGRYCIALGSYYTNSIGQKVDLVFEDGTVVRCILGDCKSDVHTDVTNRFHSQDGSVAEFIVDYAVFDKSVKWGSLCSGSIEKVVLIN